MRFSAPLSDDIKGILSTITGDLQETILRHFEEEGRRYFYHTDDPINLGTVFYKDETSEVELKDLNLIKRPIYNIKKLDLELEKLNFIVGVELGSISMEGDYMEIKEPSKPNFGKILISLEDVKCEGNIGIFTRGDSFYPLNTDLTYATSEIRIEIKTKDENDKPSVKEIKDSDVDATLVKEFWGDLQCKLTEMFLTQLSAVVVEYSAQETLIDEDEEYKEFSVKQAEKANNLIDTLAEEVITHIQDTNQTTIPTPDFTKFIKETSSNITGKLHGTKGQLLGLSSLKCSEDCSILETDSQITIYGKLECQALEHKFEKYSFVLRDKLTEGAVTTNLSYKSPIDIKIIFSKDNKKYNGSVDNKGHISIGYVDFELTGDEVGYREQIEPYFVAYIKNRVLPIMKEKIYGGFEHVLKGKDLNKMLAS